MASKKQREKWAEDPDQLAAINRALGGLPMSAKDFPRLYCEKMEYRLDLSMNIIEPDLDAEQDADLDQEDTGAVIEDDEDESAFEFLSHEERVEENIKRAKRAGSPTLFELRRDLELLNKDLDMGYATGTIYSGLQAYVQDVATARIVHIMKRITYDPDAPSVDYEWEELAGAILNEPRLSVAAQVAVMKGAIWQVKRKMIQRPVFRHFMWIMIGPQGAGKDTAMARFLSPLLDAKKMTMTFAMVLDPRLIGLWRWNFAMVFPEMQNARNSDKDALKNIITAPVLVRRPMRTNHDINVPNNAVFFGTSNNHFADMIRDNTGVRRFVPTETNKVMDYDIINETDYLSLWKSVDESKRTNPAEEYWDEIAELQEYHRVKNPTEQWARLVQDTPNIYNLYVDYKTERELFDEFTRWERRELPKEPRTVRRLFYEEMRDMTEYEGSYWEYQEIDGKASYRINPNK